MIGIKGNGTMVKKGLLVAAVALSAVTAAARPAAADFRGDRACARKYDSLNQFQRDLLRGRTAVGETRARATWWLFRGGEIISHPTLGTYVMFSGIYWKWVEKGGDLSPLGYPVEDELGAGDRRGSYCHFQGGYICWSPQTGVHEVRGIIAVKYLQLGGISGYGYPTTDEEGCPDGRGRYNHFDRNGSIYWTPQTGAHAIGGAIRDKWASLGWENSSLGYPTSEEYDQSWGAMKVRVQNFERGRIILFPGFGAVVL